MNELQRKILDIFKEVKKICNDYNIPYYAIGGTCIGAIRHNGFIPWDDDLDIAIPIENIEQFIKIASQELPRHLEVFTSLNNPNYLLPFFKVVDKRTTFIEEEEIQTPKRYKGVFIDIMPISGMPENFKLFVFKLKKYIYCNRVQRLNIKECKTLKSKIAKLFLIIFPQGYFYSKYIRLLKKYPLSSSQKTGYVWDYSVSELNFPTELFSKRVELPFEDITISCPSGYHEYLFKQFGDYRILPPKEERLKHLGFIDLNNSYKFYQCQPKKIIDIRKNEDKEVK